MIGVSNSCTSPSPTQANGHMATRYYIAIPDPDKARAAGEFAFRSQGAESMAQALQDALRPPALFDRWRAPQDDPDQVDPALGPPHPAHTADGRQPARPTPPPAPHH